MLVAMIHVGVGAFAPFVLAVAPGVRLVSQPLLGIVDSRVSPLVMINRIVLYNVVEDFVKSTTDPILPGWRPDHPTVAVDARQAKAGKEKDRQHLEPRLVVS